MSAVRDKNSRREKWEPKEGQVPLESPSKEPVLMARCACGCPNHPKALRCMACSRPMHHD